MLVNVPCINNTELSLENKGYYVSLSAFSTVPYCFKNFSLIPTSDLLSNFNMPPKKGQLISPKQNITLSTLISQIQLSYRELLTPSVEIRNCFTIYLIKPEIQKPFFSPSSSSLYRQISIYASFISFLSLQHNLPCLCLF